jgi:hypothetical protein
LIQIETKKIQIDSSVAIISLPKFIPCYFQYFTACLILFYFISSIPLSLLIPCVLGSALSIRLFCNVLLFHLPTTSVPVAPACDSASTSDNHPGGVFLSNGTALC